MNRNILILLLSLISVGISAQKNPILPELHADPDIIADGGRYYI